MAATAEGEHRRLRAEAGATPEVGAASAPPSAARNMPSVKASMKMRLVSMPSAWLTSGSATTAVSSLPCRVFLMSMRKPATTSTARRISRSLEVEIDDAADRRGAEDLHRRILIDRLHPEHDALQILEDQEERECDEDLHGSDLP